MKPPERRNGEADQNGLGDALERHAVERSAHVIGPEHRQHRGNAPQRRRHCGLAVPGVAERRSAFVATASAVFSAIPE